MIRYSAMAAGFVFRDPSDIDDFTHAEIEHSWYQVVHVSPQVVDARHVLSGAPRKWARIDCGRLVAASNEPHCKSDLSCLIGQRVRVTLAHGIVTGTVKGFVYRCTKIKLGGDEYEIKTPMQLSLGEEPWSFREIAKIELL